MNKCYKITAKLINDDENAKELFKALGRSKTGEISRTFIVEKDMPLWALHYAIERAFGFLNCHLHYFQLFEEDFKTLTQGQTSIWRKYLGIYFKSPARDFNTDYWCDDYQKGSFRNWQRKKYCSPFIYRGIYKTIDDVKKDFDAYLKDVDNKFVISESKQDKFTFTHIHPLKYWKHGEIDKRYIASINDLPLEKLHYLFENNPNDLLDTLTVEDIFLSFKRFLYSYDPGDGWEFSVEISDDVRKDDEDIVLKKKYPLMIASDGLNLVEDVGGIGGYIDFLYTLFNLKEVLHSNDKTVCLDNKYYEPINEFKGITLPCGYSPYHERSWAYSQEWEEELPDLRKWF